MNTPIVIGRLYKHMGTGQKHKLLCTMQSVIPGLTPEEDTELVTVSLPLLTMRTTFSWLGTAAQFRSEFCLL